MGRVGEIILVAAALRRAAEGDLEKVAGLFRPESSYDKFATYLRRISSSPANPYSIATAPIAGAARRATKGGVMATGKRALGLGIGGLFVHEFLTGVGDNMKANRAEMQKWGI